MTHISKSNPPTQEASLGVSPKASNKYSLENVSRMNSVPSSPSLCSSQSFSPIWSLSPKSIYDRLEFYDESDLHVGQQLEENQKLCQEVTKYRLRVEQLETELFHKSVPSDIDIRSLVQKTLQSALLEKERYRREAEKERHKREELETQLTHLNVQCLKIDEMKSDLQDKKEQIKILQSQLVEAIQDIDHLQELNEETTCLLRSLYFQIPDFLLSRERKTVTERKSDPESVKFSYDNFISKVTNLIEESHEMVDKILTLQTRNEELVNLQQTHENKCPPDPQESDANSSSKGHCKDKRNVHNIIENLSNPEESWLPIEVEEVQTCTFSSNEPDPLGLSSDYINSSKANIQMVVSNLRQTQEELTTIKEALTDLEENGIMYQLELDEVTNQRDELIEELREKEEELLRIRSTKIVPKEKCTLLDKEDKLEHSCFLTSPKEPNLNYLFVQEMQNLRVTLSQVQIENQRLTHEIQQSSRESTKYLEMIIRLHNLLGLHTQRSDDKSNFTGKGWNCSAPFSPVIAPTMYECEPDASLQVVPTQGSPRLSSELACSIEWDSYHYDQDQNVVKEEMESIIKSLDMLHLNEV